jgi:hypothetical protein
MVNSVLSYPRRRKAAFNVLSLIGRCQDRTVHEFFGHGFKSVGPCHSRIAALFLAVDGGVDPFGKQPLGIVALDARVRERRDGILAQREQLLLGGKVVRVALIRSW